MMLRIKIPCWLCIVQVSLTLLSLRCGLVNCELSIYSMPTIDTSISLPCLRSFFTNFFRSSGVMLLSVFS